MSISLIFLSAIITILTTLMRQRLSVPELSNQKFKNSLVLFFGFISIISLFMIFFLNKLSLYFSRIHGLIDIIFNITFMLSSFISCLYSYNLLNKLPLKENPANFGYNYYKKIILIGMFTQLTFYMFNYFLISFYNPLILTEKILLSGMIIFININFFIYYFLFAIFIYTLKYDLYYVNLQLEIIPDLEFFLDAKEELIRNHYEKMI
jgi:hypothetical protein